MTPPSHPLTHHEILGLIGPFTRRGRQVDLAASNRMARRLVFKAIEPAGGVTSVPGLRESLQLEHVDTHTFRLTRSLSFENCRKDGPENGLEARLEAEGPEPAELLERIEAIPAERQIRAGAGFVIARSHRLEAGPAHSPRDAPGARLVLTHGIARIDGLTLTLEPPTVRGMRADLSLQPAANESYVLPEDLLAVLGRDWSRLAEAGKGWRSSLRLRGRGIAASLDAEAKLDHAAAHLARTLAEPPARFHERLLAARWRVYGRRGVPLLSSIALVAAAASVPKLNLAQDSAWRMLIFNAPPLMLGIAFCLRELPRIEIPPWPRPSAAAAWRTTTAALEPHPETDR